MENWLQQFIEFLPTGIAYLSSLFLVCFLESLPIVGLLIPGSTLVVLAGFLVLVGKCTFSLVATLAIAGGLLGDLFSFWLGYYYGSKFLKMRGFQRHRNLVHRSERFFVDHGGKSIFFARFLGPIRGITPFIAGLSSFPGKSFCGYALVSSILWGICYPGIGYLGGSSWHQAQSLTAKFGLIIFGLLLITILNVWIRRNFKKAKIDTEDQ
ncbi:membrane-associated protein [Desulfuromusa kysingii]|uniref:Membrane-associated protein n=1 Tax=Desulfuromusa kysingii TaxID=37625 RepID=A0A1H4EA87_9BACT|nr:DedA family protein [Desulfuromusa kysingii]SEA81737.1 membrane-associated protein [Desulfuromusa kysingii]